jgi:hypothetical protein
MKTLAPLQEDGLLQWERNQFIAKDHEGKEFFLRRIG